MITKHINRLGLVAMLFIARVAAGAQPTSQPTVTWQSVATGKLLNGIVLQPAKPPVNSAGLPPAIIYMKNLALPRLGQEPDETILNDLLAAGNLVVVLDYAHDPHSISPDLNADMLKLRQDIGGKARSFLTEYKLDVNEVFILLEGFRLKRDVDFAQDGKRVLGMDVQYPSHPAHPALTLMEITCDNVNRMGMYSLLFCHDTLTDGGMAAGFAVAMIDHPVPPPYKGIDDPMPQCIYRLKAAVRTLRSMDAELDMNGKIGAVGFSRGGPMAAFLAVTGNHPELEGDGPHKDISSAVQAALIHGCRYDYSQLAPDDPMLKRYEKAWGTFDTKRDAWLAHGPALYLTHDAAPMFLDTSNAESKEYQGQLALFEKELTAAGVEHHYQVDADGRGHQVSTDPKTLAAIYAFFHQHLDN